MRLSLVVATNNQHILERDLMSSELVSNSEVEICVVQDAISAASAYNFGIDNTNCEVIVFAHHDVFFPKGWEVLLEKTIEKVSALDGAWGLLAPFGIHSLTSNHCGYVWSTSLGGVLGCHFEEIIPAQSFDELVIVMKRSSGLRFDENLNEFHMYGTDIVQSAQAKGVGAYIACLPVVHNDNFHHQLGPDFTRAYNFMRKKWRSQLPIRTPVLNITSSIVPLKLQNLRMWKSSKARRKKALDSNITPLKWAEQAGWGDLA